MNATKTMIYVGFNGTRQTAATYDLEALKRLAEKNPGTEIYGMSEDSYKEGLYPYGWDGPTFRIMAEKIE